MRLIAKVRAISFLAVLLSSLFAYAQEYILVDPDSPVIQTIKKEALEKSAPAFNYANLFRDHSWSGGVPMPSAQAPVSFIGHTPTPLDLPKINWDAGKLTRPSVDTYLQSMQEIQAQIQATLSALDQSRQRAAGIGSSVDPNSTHASDAGAVFARIEMMKRALAQLNSSLSLDIARYCSEKNLFNFAAADNALTGVQSLNLHLSRGEFPITPVRLTRLELIPVEQLNSLVEKRIHDVYDPAISRILFNPFDPSHGAARAEKARVRNQARVQVSDAINRVDTRHYEPAAAQISAEAEKAVSQLAGLSQKMISNWDSSPVSNEPAILSQQARDSANNAYQFSSGASELHHQIVAVNAELVRVEPKTETSREARRLGIDATVAADQALTGGENEMAETYLDFAVAMTDIALGLTPVVGWVKDGFEAVTGRRLLTMEELTPFERGMAVFGVATIGLGSKFVAGAAVVSRAKRLLQPLVKVGDKGFEAAAKIAAIIAESPLGRVALRARTAGIAEIGEKTFQALEKASEIHNPFPADGVYAHAVKRAFVDDILGAKVTPASARVNERWITAAEDLRDVASEGLSQRLSLYIDEAGTIHRDTSDYVIMEFKFNRIHDPALTSPVDFDLANPRKFGWIPGGRTSGGVREWVVPPNVFSNGMVDLTSIKIRALK